MKIIEGIEVIPVGSLGEAVDFLAGEKRPLDIEPAAEAKSAPPLQPDMSDIRGQESAKRALEISAAGGHNLLMIVPPGTGKTMLAKRITGILPPMNIDEALETTMIYSVAGLVDAKKPLLENRPFRTPHHTASDISIIGGGRHPRPGEVSLAHNGVLFLDEIQQFRSNVLQVLRQPLEDEKITISRAEGSVEYPANFMLVAALNPSKKNIDLDRWDLEDMKTIINKLSGPLLDRIDIQVQVSRIKYEQLTRKTGFESSETILARVITARNIQRERLKGFKIHTNSQMGHRLIEQHCQLSAGGESLLKLAMEKFLLSIRAYDKILKISRTIADLDKQESIQDYHVSEALQYRILDRVLNFN
jgi:magnesium chelatase family protein